MISISQGQASRGNARHHACARGKGSTTPRRRSPKATRPTQSRGKALTHACRRSKGAKTPRRTGGGTMIGIPQRQASRGKARLHACTRGKGSRTPRRRGPKATRPTQSRGKARLHACTKGKGSGTPRRRRARAQRPRAAREGRTHARREARKPSGTLGAPREGEPAGNRGTHRPARNLRPPARPGLSHSTSRAFGTGHT